MPRAKHAAATRGIRGTRMETPDLSTGLLVSVPHHRAVRVVTALVPAHRAHVSLHHRGHHLQPSPERCGVDPGGVRASAAPMPIVPDLARLSTQHYTVRLEPVGTHTEEDTLSTSARGVVAPRRLPVITIVRDPWDVSARCRSHSSVRRTATPRDRRRWTLRSSTTCLQSAAAEAKLENAMPSVFDVTDFLHPLDLSARQQLESIPLLQRAVKKYLSMVGDRTLRQKLLGSALRLGPRQLPDIYRMLPPICDAFGIEEPELYLMRGNANAMTVGHSCTAIVIYNQLLEDLAEDEIQAVLAHECGHILAEHILYRQMVHTMLRAGAEVGARGDDRWKVLAQIVMKQAEIALLDWYRKSELTADRAAVAYLGDPEPMQRALFRVIGVPKWMPGEVSYTAILEQADEFDQITESSGWDRYLAETVVESGSHPIPAIRMRELTIWAQSDTFQQLLRIAKIGRLEQRVGCSQCGQELAPEWRFCQRCGTPVPQAADNQIEGAS